MVGEAIMSPRQLIRALVKLCKEKASGTVFLNVDDSHSARLVLNHGVICWIAYDNLRGEAAIDAISEIDTARLNFNPILKLAIGEQELPTTAEVLKRLDRHGSDEQDQSVPIVTDVVSPLPPTDMGGDRPFNQERVRQVLERESMEYLGPMARLLCGDYMKSLRPHLSHAEVRQVISALLQDINDEQKGQRFMERVKRELGIH